MNNPHELIFEKAVCFGYRTRVFSVERDAGTVAKTATRKLTEKQEVVHPSRVAPLNNLKQEAFRLCRGFGTKFELLGLWIVPNGDADACAEGLLDISNRWVTWTKDELIPNYPLWVEKYALENPDDAANILRLAPSLEDIKANTRFSFARINLSETAVNAINLEEEVEGLWGQVLHDIAAELKDSKMHKSQTYTQEGIREAFSRILRKCEGLGFLHPRLQEVSDMIRTVVSQLPSTGMIKGIDALAVKSCIDALMNTNEFARRGFGVGTDFTDKDAGADAAGDQAPMVDSFTGAVIQPDAAAHSGASDAAPDVVAPASPETQVTDVHSAPSLDEVFAGAPAAAPTPVDQPEEALALATDFSGW